MPDRLPTALWVDGVLATLTARGIFYYFAQKGDPSTGLLLLKLTDTRGKVRLLTQQRDFLEDKLVWVDALDIENPQEKDADAFIQKAIQRDPDLWALEIEDATLVNPFTV